MKARFLLAMAVCCGLMLGASAMLAQAQEPAPQGQDMAMAPLGSGFTYQGRLLMGGAPVTGASDFQFSLWDEATAGAQIGITLTKTGVVVTDGLFTVLLDLSATAFGGYARWLEVSVRSPAGSGDYTTLSPRQVLTAVPYALYAMAAPWNGLIGVPPGFADGVDNDTVYSAGTGLALVGTTFDVVTSTIQERVNGVCGSGYAIRQVNSDGTVLCEPAGQGDITTVYAGPGLSGGGASGEVTLTVAFAGAGSASTAARSDHLHDAAYWKLTGNSGTVSGTHFLGTTDWKPLELRVNNAAALRLEPTGVSPNVIGGYWGNGVLFTPYGATIGGGGQEGSPNYVTGDHGTVSGGLNNTAWSVATVGGGISNTAGSGYATVGGGEANTANAVHAVVGGGLNNTANGPACTVAGGGSNTASDGNATVGGGYNNKANIYAATIGGGQNHVASGPGTAIGGGYGNKASGEQSTVAGGAGNTAGPGNYATVAGGANNTASSPFATVGGGWLNVASGEKSTVGGGYNNTASVDRATISGGSDNSATHIAATIGGGWGNAASAADTTIAGGTQNTASGWRAAVGGGNSNTAGPGSYSIVAGGYANTADDESSAIGGGRGNSAGGAYSVVAGGQSSAASGEHSTVAGGHNNIAGPGNYATVGGGYQNTASGVAATIPGGLSNSAQGNYSFAAGRRAKANHQGAFVWGDSTDADLASTASNQFLTRATGGVNFYTGSAAFQINGNAAWHAGNDGSGSGLDADLLDGQHGSYYQNAASLNAGILSTDRYSAYADLSAEGYLNNNAGSDLLDRSQADGRYWSLTGNTGTNLATHFLGTTDNQALELRVNNARALRLEPAGGVPNLIGGHSSNRVVAGASGATIGGGSGNTVGSSHATVAGGADSTAGNYFATVGGGNRNEAAGLGSTVPGGRNNSAQGWFSFAAGNRAKAMHSGAFVWADYADADVASTGDNQFIVRASGGIWFGNNSSPSLPAGRFINTSTGGYLSSGGAWTNSSDRQSKENVAPVDGQAVLASLSQVPISTWSYKSEDPSVRHIGPMAQDFYAAFAVGEDDTHISTVDAEGVSLAAVQALYELSQQQAGRIEELEHQNAALEDRLTALETLLAEWLQGQSRGGQ